METELQSAKVSAIPVRKMTFELAKGKIGLWNPEKPELSHMLNAFQLALPHLEPYFIQAVTEASPLLSDPQLKADVVAFCGQEANHARQHSHYCRLLRERYPCLAEHEKRIQAFLSESRKRDSLEWRLAYTAGYEAITAQLGRMIFQNPANWFESSDPYFKDLMAWHGAEEIEHRHVAFDVLQAVAPEYSLRAKALWAAIKRSYAEIVPVVTGMLEADGYAGRSDSKIRRWKVRVFFLRQLLPSWIRYLKPSYHPSQDPEPPEYLAWQRAHHSSPVSRD